MGGVLPKDPAQRARRNRKSTHHVIDASSRVEKRPPLTKELLGVEVVPSQVQRWWRVVWASPLATQWIEADVEVLYLLAALRCAFLEKPTAAMAGEIRLQETRLGLDLMARRRLDWRIEETKGGVPEYQPVEEPEDGDDARLVLRAVK